MAISFKAKRAKGLHIALHLFVVRSHVRSSPSTFFERNMSAPSTFLERYRKNDTYSKKEFATSLSISGDERARGF